MLLFSEDSCFARVIHACHRPVIRITRGGPALRVHRADTMVDGLPRAASLVHEKLLRTRARMTSNWANNYLCVLVGFLDIAPRPPIQIA